MEEIDIFFSKEIPPENGKWSELRKYRKDLTVAGNAILWFGVWSVIKAYLTLLLNEELRNYLIRLKPAEFDQAYADLLFLILLAGLIFAFHFLIYRGADREGHGVKTGPLYLILAGVYMPLCIISIFVTLLDGTGLQNAGLASVLLDAGAALICGDVLYNGIRCRRFTEKPEQQGGDV
ncbi:MAG: hypothetical protein IKS32_13335 [Solobacterium sp.]|nr:hypothetical protein [Solobacterium sp.]